MMTPGMLQRRSQDAAERIERERKLEEEQRHREAEKRRRQEENRRIIEIEQAKLNESVKRALAHTIKLAIKAAISGERSVCIELAPEVAAGLNVELGKIEMGHSVAVTNARPSKLIGRLNKLVEKVGQYPEGDSYKNRLTTIQQRMEAGGQRAEDDEDVIGQSWWGDVIQKVIDDIKEDKTYVGSDAVVLYFNLNVKQLLESTSPYATETTVEISWTPKDVEYYVLSEPHHLPSWVLSKGGAGLIQSLGACMAMDADNGNEESSFEIEELPAKPERWGQNKMTKFIHHGRPVGVCPFTISIFSQAIEAMGFTVETSKLGQVRGVTIRW